jgi:hypothetical protein
MEKAHISFLKVRPQSKERPFFINRNWVSIVVKILAPLHGKMRLTQRELAEFFKIPSLLKSIPSVRLEPVEPTFGR